MFITVFTQVVILFILIFLGVLLTKTKTLTENGIKSITDFVLYTVTPCVIIKSFVRSFSLDLLKNLSIALLAAVVAHILFIAISLFLLKSKDISRQKVLQFSVIFSNCGYMSLPLLQAVLGDNGVFFGSAYIAIFQIVVWSYGVFLMGDGINTITTKKLILNPGVVGFVIAFLIFVLQIPVPKIIYEPVSYLAALNTPLPMVIIGYHLANSNFLSGLKDIKLLFACGLKLFILPIIVVLGFFVCGIRGTLPIALTICASAPTAAISTMFAAKFGRDTSLSVTAVSLSTVLSIISMPIVATLAQHLLK